MPMRSPALLVVLALVGCTRTETVVADMTPATPSSGKPKVEEPKVEPEVPAPPVQFASRAEDAPQLGAACVDPSLCGTRRRVAVRAYRDHRFGNMGDAPCSPVSLTGERIEQYARSACVAGDRVYVRSSCVVCRMPSTDVVEAVVTEMTTSQREFVQKQAGLAAVGPLLSSAEWDLAIRDALRNKPKK